MSRFKKATLSQAKARVALTGPSGAGKTWSAIKLARALVGEKGRIAVIDTEHGSASKYARLTDFDVLELHTFAPAEYISALEDAAKEGFDAIVVDSLSHAWMGPGGVMEIVDNAASRSKGNKFAGWKEGTPAHNALIQAIQRSPAHVIATMRSKTEYLLEEENGKTKPKKIGMAPVQREGMEYEYDVALDLDLDHLLMVTKTRCEALDRWVLRPPHNVEKLGEILRAWLSDGAPADPKATLGSEARVLVGLLEAIVAAEPLAGAIASAKKDWKKMSKADQAAVTAAVEAAKVRVGEAERAAAEKAQAEAAAKASEQPPAPAPADELEPGGHDEADPADVAGDEQPTLFT